MPQLMRTSNPALSADSFRTGEATFGESMTVSGTVNKTGILLILCVATAAWTWNRFFNAPPEEAMQVVGPALAIGGIGGFIVAIVTIFKKQWRGSPRQFMRCWRVSCSAESPLCWSSATTASPSRQSR